MKIAVTGTHRVGKTTLIEELQKTLSGYECRQEPYYELEEKGYIFSEIPGIDDYIEQLEYSIEQVYSSEENVIFDRSPIDILAYIQALNELDDISSLYQKVKNAVIELDLLIYVPIEEPDLIPCAESELPELRYKVNDILNEWVWDFGIETIEVSGNLTARRDQVINKIVQI